MACLCGAEVAPGGDFCPEHRAEYRELLREFEAHGSRTDVHGPDVRDNHGRSTAQRDWLKGEARMATTIKTEHAGPKKGKGYWGRKKEAKQVSNKKRRQRDREAVREG